MHLVNIFVGLTDECSVEQKIALFGNLEYEGSEAIECSLC